MNPLVEKFQKIGWLERLPGWEKCSLPDLPDRVVTSGLASAEEVLETLSQLYGLPASSNPQVSPEATSLLSQELCDYWSMLPLRRQDGRVQVAMADPWDLDAVQFLFLRVQCPIDIVVCLRSDLQEASSRGFSAGGLDVVSAAPAADLSRPAEREFQDAPVVKLVQHLIEQGVNLSASDIHLEPDEQGGTLRYRIDGSLQPFPHPAPRLHAAAVARVKVMANLNVSETRFPQDGRISLQVGKRKVDLRVSTLPLADGEGVVLRILDTSGVALDLEKLGLPAGDYEIYRQAVRAPHGLVLLAGPTGSGKTTTLYATLKLLSTPDRKIISVEDPVEYRLKGIHQSPVREEIGYTFEMGLRAILRHDPDVVMIGEIRDRISADIAVRSALTGHMVLSTIHTNDSAQAVTRLVEMGVPDYLVTAVLRLVLSQRLLRRLCLHCRQGSRLDVTGFGLPPELETFQPVGCPHCHSSGYAGRLAIYELLEAGRLARNQAPLVPNRTLRQAGLQLLLDGQTSLEEVVRVTADY